MAEIKILEHYPPIHNIFNHFHQEPYAVFLDSSLQNELGQYSIIGRKPYRSLTSKNGTTYLDGNAVQESFLSVLQSFLQTEYEEKHIPELPLTAGAIGYLSYDFGRMEMGIPSRHTKQSDIPDALMIFYEQFIIEDHWKKKLYFISNVQDETARETLDTLSDMIQALNQKETNEMTDSQNKSILADFTKKEYCDAITAMREYIRNGDIYVANMTQQLQIQSTLTPYTVYRKIRTENPSPFGGYLHGDGFEIICASPERFLEIKNRTAVTRPIKGTRKRGETPEEDYSYYSELQNSEKDKSELLMITDLERNDFNRVCIPGSVTVKNLFEIETYATVYHLSTTVTGQLESDKTAVDLIRAAFPGGSITGAPKYRAMEIIDELEHHQRNLYTGILGYFSLNGDCDFNIIIRTLLHENGIYTLGVGGGITWESDHDAEYEETLQKASAFLKTFQIKEAQTHENRIG